MSAGIGIKKLRKEMERTLKPDRYEHSIGVAYTAAALAMRHGADVQQALVAGILHDCAKGMDHEEQLKICRKHDLPVSEFELKNLKLLHAKVGAYLARHTYGIEDPEILSAITWHTTGRPGMTKLEKIIFLADIIEPNRKPYAELPLLRQAIFEDLEEGLKLTLKHLVIYLQSTGDPLDPMTEETYRYYSSSIQDFQEAAGGSDGQFEKGQ